MKTEYDKSKLKIIILITGSIAAVRVPLLVSKLVKENFEIKCVLSKKCRKVNQTSFVIHLKSELMRFRK